jgi:hypothetical protein
MSSAIASLCRGRGLAQPSRGGYKFRNLGSRPDNSLLHDVKRPLLISYPISHKSHGFSSRHVFNYRFAVLRCRFYRRPPQLRRHPRPFIIPTTASRAIRIYTPGRRALSPGKGLLYSLRKLSLPGNDVLLRSLQYGRPPRPPRPPRPSPRPGNVNIALTVAHRRLPPTTSRPTAAPVQ